MSGILDRPIFPECQILIRKLLYRVKIIMNRPKLSGIIFFKFQCNTCWQQKFLQIFLYEPKMSGTLFRH